MTRRQLLARLEELGMLATANDAANTDAETVRERAITFGVALGLIAAVPDVYLETTVETVTNDFDRRRAVQPRPPRPN